MRFDRKDNCGLWHRIIPQPIRFIMKRIMTNDSKNGMKASARVWRVLYDYERKTTTFSQAYDIISLPATITNIQKESSREEVNRMLLVDQLQETAAPVIITNDTGRLLRSLGATGRLYGYKYMEYIVDYMSRHQDDHQFLTKVVYPETAKHFHVSPSSVERAVRTLIQAIWKRSDHSNLDYVAGVQLEKAPTNSEFIDMVVAFIQYKS